MCYVCYPPKAPSMFFYDSDVNHMLQDQEREGLSCSTIFFVPDSNNIWNRDQTKKPKREVSQFGAPVLHPDNRLSLEADLDMWYCIGKPL